MGKGRAPCCDKSKVKKGPWSPAEDLRLITFIQKHGHENWRALPKQAGLLRCGKSCRLRWINYLRPDVKRGNFTKEEEDTIIKLHQTLGNKWSKIASHLPGRTDNEIKNVWNTHLKKKVPNKDSHSSNDSKESSSITTTSTSSSSSSNSNATMANMEVDDHDHQWVKKKKRVSYNNDQETDKAINDQDQDHQLGNSVFDFSSTEVNKPEFDQEISTADIPFESDFDFWNMLDGLNNNNNNINTNNNHNNNNNNHSQSSSSIEEDENRKWLKYLENELGLENGGNKDHHLHHHHQSLAEAEAEADLLENFQYEIMPTRPEMINYEMGYYHLWPSL